MNTDFARMKRKRTIANLLQDTNTLVTTPTNTSTISSLLPCTVSIESEKKTFVKEYFDNNSNSNNYNNNNIQTLSSLTATLEDAETDITHQTINKICAKNSNKDNFVNNKRVQFNENDTLVGTNKTTKKSKIKDYVFNAINNINNTGSNTNNSINNSQTSSTQPVVSILVSENSTLTKTANSNNINTNEDENNICNNNKKKTIGSLINSNNIQTSLITNNRRLKTKIKESKKSKIKDYIQVDILDQSSLSNDTLISQINSTPTTPLVVSTILNNNQIATTKLNNLNNNNNSNNTIVSSISSTINAKTKRTKIKDYISSPTRNMSISDLIVSSNKNESKKMKVKNHLLKQEQKQKEQHQHYQTKTEPTEPTSFTATSKTTSLNRPTATNNKSTIKEYLQKNQRNKLINNKENLISKRLYFKNNHKQD